MIQYMADIKLSDLTREQRAQMIIHDSSKYVKLLEEEDVDRLLANLSKRPIKQHTKDHDDLEVITKWWKERYPERAEALKEYEDYL